MHKKRACTNDIDMCSFDRSCTYIHNQTQTSQDHVKAKSQKRRKNYIRKLSVRHIYILHIFLNINIHKITKQDIL